MDHDVSKIKIKGTDMICIEIPFGWAYKSRGKGKVNFIMSFRDRQDTPPSQGWC